MTSSSSSSSHHAPPRRLTEWAAPFAGWLLGAAVFFRIPLRSELDQLFGDAGDARLVTLLHEHWVAVLRGDRGWRDPGFFHGYEGALGFSDTVALDAVFYVPLRALGLDPFAALQLTLVLLSAVGFASTFVLLRRVVGLALPPSIALAGIATFPNALGNAASHPQLFLVHWVPLALLLVVAAMRASGRTGHILGALGGALWGLIIFSAFYVGWSAALALLITGTIWVGLRPHDRVRTVLAAVRARATVVAAIAGGLLVSLVPFAATYVPVLDDIGGRSYREVMYLAPAPGDMVNVGIGSFAWGAVLNRLFAGSTARLGNPEVSLAPTPLLILALLAAAVLAWAGRRGRGGTDQADLVIALAATAALLLVLPVRWDGWSLWAGPWHVVPGVSAIRATGRVWLVITLVGALAVGVALQRALPTSERDGRRRARLVLAAALALGVVWAEQANRTRSSGVDRSDQLAALDAITEPPGSCLSFYVVDSSGRRRPYHLPAIDAMFVAMHTGLPTINGYSGTTPPGYQADALTALDVADPRYERLVARWVDRHDLSDGLCRYDLAGRSWTVDPPLPEPYG